MKITDHKAEKIKDPFGILEGDRYECHLYATVDEEDDLYSLEGFYIRVLYVITETEQKIAGLFLHNRGDDSVLDFELEDDEIELVREYCAANIKE
ncbi:DUF6509 family protein [Domibacillus epiphyticus]|uniref:Pullulanase n=1 Tax=Domibacillus epiphyticus TaxID=1714355 RepID=A0A1V2A7S3_9BACI|nr:DUF6509 family protein [Domibacillus epiphyticus]OMP66980.1 pullulanase [Domibacillus epiphyticus]